MRLYYDPLSTSSRPILMFAEEHAVPLELELVSLIEGAQKAPAYLALNPNGTIPLLEDGDLQLIESSAILKYLADKVGSPAYPLDLKTRARINAAMDWLFGFHSAFGLGFVYPQMLPQYRLDDPAQQALVLEQGLAATERRLDVLDAHMIGPNRNYCCGPELTLADYMGGSIFALADAIGFDLSPWPNVARWVATLKGRPSWVSAHAGFRQMFGQGPAQRAGGQA
ncbi:glutathione S-transferase family protein [Phenylobacterium sp.]|uniref:glutathione S-transferase family protein n=1 Tax=Phenylobacterium sp. TaxID=1871053 RepID=UPI00301E0A95